MSARPPSVYLPSAEPEAVVLAAQEVAAGTDDMVAVMLAENGAPDLSQLVERLAATPVSFFGGLFPSLIEGQRQRDTGALLFALPKLTEPFLVRDLDTDRFAVPDVPATTTKVVANGYELTVGREPPPGQTASPPTAGNYGQFSYLVGPDGVKVELVTNKEPNAPPIMHHHVHFTNKMFVEMQQFFMKAFNATLRPGQTDFFIGADLQGVGYSLNFFHWEPAADLVGTKGRAVDHVGFEVKNLEAFCKELEAKGIKLTEKYHRDKSLNIMSATIVDPYGTVLELTEGLRQLP